MGGEVTGWLIICFLCILHWQVTYYSSSFFSNSSLLPQLCSSEESSALLNFKNSFSNNTDVFVECRKAHLKTNSWKENTDCCTWDGVTCNRRTGHVIGLDLSCNWIFGTFHSNNTLFRLPHLQRLNLAYNDFNHSRIPSEFGTSLTGLTHLNLSNSGFSGKIPAELSHLSKLVSLDLSQDGSELRKQNFKRLVQNLTEIREFVLNQVDMFSVDLDSLRNVSSSLIFFSLYNCRLQGRLPDNIFRLPNLQMLNLGYNMNLTGYFPKSNWSRSFTNLDLSATRFSGNLPNSIGNLKALNSLRLRVCQLYGPLPASLGNLTQLTDLTLSNNQFSGEIPSSLSNLVQLQMLELSRNNLTGHLPRITNLRQLVHLHLSYNQLVGSIPSGGIWAPKLENFFISYNKLNGTIPSWLYRLPSLVAIGLRDNGLTGFIEEFQYRSLMYIDLSNNELQGPIPRSIFEQVNLTDLYLFSNHLSGSVDLYVSPELKNIRGIDISNNNIGGLIPKWLWNSGVNSLEYLNISHNLLEGFDHFTGILPWYLMWYLDLQSNLLHGSLPLLPSPGPEFYSVANNKLSGVLPPLICNMSSFKLLDLSNNNFSGLLPPCLGNFSNSLTVLNLRRNHFHGRIPQNFAPGSMLRSLDVSENQLQGLVPRSLAHCTELDVLNLGDNKIFDIFPFWLEILPKLQVLVLRSNRFHGPIPQPKRKLSFSNLNIIDVSYNEFTGRMPYELFESLRSMATINNSSSERNYMGEKNYYYFDSLTLVSKGLEIDFVRILTIFRAIDFSNNKFEGEIPNSIGNLKSVRVLNFSSNSLRGPIPSSLGNLSVIESLDLSNNNLSGEIPKQLTSLTSLSIFDVSQNHLEGPIPQGSQFNTFSNNSYDGNSGLCGFPLTKKCGIKEEAPTPPSKAEESQSSSLFTMDLYMWIVVLMGYGCGLVIGVVGGNYIMQRKEEWLVKIFGIGQHRRRRRLNTRRQNGGGR